jgi:hypothetical protein
VAALPVSAEKRFTRQATVPKGTSEASLASSV